MTADPAGWTFVLTYEDYPSTYDVSHTDGRVFHFHYRFGEWAIMDADWENISVGITPTDHDPGRMKQAEVRDILASVIGASE